MASFLDHWLDSDYKQRDDIDEAKFQAELARVDLDQLRDVVGRQRRELFELKATVAMLMRLLDEAGVVPAATLRARVDAELAGLAEAARPEHRQVQCIRCRRTVPAIQTELTEDGPLCGPCVNA
jgi:hypothetical protein